MVVQNAETAVKRAGIQLSVLDVLDPRILDDQSVGIFLSYLQLSSFLPCLACFRAYFGMHLFLESLKPLRHLHLVFFLLHVAFAPHTSSQDRVSKSLISQRSPLRSIGHRHVFFPIHLPPPLHFGVHTFTRHGPRVGDLQHSTPVVSSALYLQDCCARLVASVISVV